MLIVVSLIALALLISIAAIVRLFGRKVRPEMMEEMYLLFVLTVFVFPIVAAIYGGLALILYNFIARWSGWPELSLPWWPAEPGESAAAVPWYMIPGWLGVFTGAIALIWFYARR
jgi:hypothetical protein